MELVPVPKIRCPSLSPAVGCHLTFEALACLLQPQIKVGNIKKKKNIHSVLASTGDALQSCCLVVPPWEVPVPPGEEELGQVSHPLALQQCKRVELLEMSNKKRKE